MMYLAALILSISSQPAAPAQDPFGPVIDGAYSASQVAEKKVAYFFEAMEKGKYHAATFPKYLGWGEIPALLQRAEGKMVLHSFPLNPASSQTQAECTEGMVALWIVEGIRVGGKFPSNNPIGLGPYGGLSKSEAQATSEHWHPTIAKAYARWWNEVKDLPKDRAAAIGPLDRTGLRWF